jgi:3-oxoacyl-(acyl-carrier-protein) synthase
MSAYIRGAAVLSPQKTFEENGFPGEIMNYPGVSSLKCIEPVYRDFIDPMVARRMSRIVKMGVCSALKCMKDTGIDMPDGIIAGTGLGCIEDTDKFLTSIYNNGEKLLNPTPFIQSTHNTVAGAIALAIKCHSYNATYTHRGFSFESALEDALLQLAETPSLNILTGGFDELTENSYILTKRMGLWKNHPIDNTKLTGYGSRGSLPGEGVAFFMLGGLKGPNDMAKIKSFRTFYRPADEKTIENQISEFLAQTGTEPSKIDLAILGMNGDESADKIYRQLMTGILSDLPCIDFKYLCGEYDTASSFALWLASLILRQQRVAGRLINKNKSPEKLNQVLIYNHLRGINHSLFLLERC